MYSSGELFMRSREGYFDVYFPSCEATREIKHQNNTLVHNQFVTRVNVTSYFLHDIRIIQWRWELRSLCILYIASVFRTLCLCDATTWQVISNSLDIDFIHYNIHGQSCKNMGCLLGCLLRAQILISVVPSPLVSCMQYHVVQKPVIFNKTRPYVWVLSQEQSNTI